MRSLEQRVQRAASGEKRTWKPRVPLKPEAAPPEQPGSHEEHCRLMLDMIADGLPERHHAHQHVHVRQRGQQCQLPLPGRRQPGAPRHLASRQDRGQAAAVPDHQPLARGAIRLSAAQAAVDEGRRFDGPRQLDDPVRIGAERRQQPQPAQAARSCWAAAAADGSTPASTACTRKTRRWRTCTCRCWMRSARRWSASPTAPARCRECWPEEGHDAATAELAAGLLVRRCFCPPPISPASGWASLVSGRRNQVQDFAFQFVQKGSDSDRQVVSGLRQHADSEGHRRRRPDQFPGGGARAGRQRDQ